MPFQQTQQQTQQPAAGSMAGCSGCPHARGLGFTFDPSWWTYGETSSPAGPGPSLLPAWLDWKTLALAAVAAYFAWKFYSGSRDALRERAARRLKERRRRIETQYKRELAALED